MSVSAGAADTDGEALSVRAFQRRIEEIYGVKDASRGTAGSFMWLVEEVGELSRALRRGKRVELEGEFADVFAWLATLASMHGVELETVARAKYGAGCPRCHAAPCCCAEPQPAHGD